jgi:hypothetical protein
VIRDNFLCEEKGKEKWKKTNTFLSVLLYWVWAAVAIC